MKNTVTITTVGKEVHVIAKVNANPIGKAILLMATLSAIIGVGVLLYNTEAEAVKSMILPLFALSFIVIYFLGRYTLWNLYGREIFHISTSSFNYQYDYGLYKSAIGSIAFVGLMTDYPNKEQPEGVIEFIMNTGLQDEDDDEWAFVNHSSITHAGTVVIAKGELAVLDTHLKKLFDADANKATQFIPNTSF